MNHFAAIVSIGPRPPNVGLASAMLAQFGQPRAWANERVALAAVPNPVVGRVADAEQPLRADGDVWLVGHARLDNRDELARELARDVTTPDLELALAAYRRWGEACVQHVLGDFSLVFWDDTAQALFCARDHFGVSPMYRAQTATQLVFANSLSAMRSCADLPATPDDVFIAGFLAKVDSTDLSRTPFAHIQRLPPAHTLSWSAGGSPRVRRYWSLPIEDELRFKRESDVVDEFKSLFDAAVWERVREPRVVVSLSGGLDSTSVAAAALRGAARRNVGLDLRGVCMVYDRLIPDEERAFTTLAANGLKVPTTFVVNDDLPLFAPATRPRSPQLDETLNYAGVEAYDDAVIAHSRSVLTGYGGDPACYPSQRYLWNLLTSLRWRRFADATLSARRLCGYWPSLYARSILRGQRQFELGQPNVPSWLNADFATRSNVRERASAVRPFGEGAHPTRPEAHEGMLLSQWVALFEVENPLGIERRFPFFDVRLIQFLLRLPPVPWFVSKRILREAGRGVLPEEIRRRPKTPVRGDTLMAKLETADWRGVLAAAMNDRMSEYVTASEVMTRADAEGPRFFKSSGWRIVALSEWLRRWVTNK